MSGGILNLINNNYMSDNPIAKAKEGDTITAYVKYGDNEPRIRHGKVIGKVFLYEESDGLKQWRYQINDDIPFEFVPEDKIELIEKGEGDSV